MAKAALMRKKRTISRLAVPLALVVMLAGAAAAKSLNVQVKAGQVRGAPSFLAPVVAVLEYGTGVEVLDEQNGWTQVRTASTSGWIHSSALTTKALSLSAGQADAAKGARSDELALAGKGFNREVEGQYRAGRSGAGYAWIDRMEQFNLPAPHLNAFLQQGGVAPQGGAQ